MTKREILCERMIKLLKNRPYNANRNHVDKIARQIKELDSKMAPIGPAEGK